jgi:hypothetical protein
MHDPPIRSTEVGALPRVSFGVTLTALVLAVSAAGVVNVTEKFVEARGATVLGLAETLSTAPVGVPIV